MVLSRQRKTQAEKRASGFFWHAGAGAEEEATDEAAEAAQPEWVDDGSLPLQDDALPFFLLDAHEEAATPGRIYLFGKVAVTTWLHYMPHQDIVLSYTQRCPPTPHLLRLSYLCQHADWCCLSCE
jgi:hypothetical protein